MDMNKILSGIMGVLLTLTIGGSAAVKPGTDNTGTTVSTSEKTGVPGGG